MPASKAGAFPPIARFCCGLLLHITEKNYFFRRWNVGAHHSLDVLLNFGRVTYGGAKFAKFLAEIWFGPHARVTVTASDGIEIIVQYAGPGDVRRHPESVQQFMVANNAEI